MNSVLNKILIKAFLLLHERKYKGRLKYIYEDNHSDTLLVVFSGFSSTKRPLYNYVRTLQKLKSMNKLFILDDFGFRGSYYWFENGNDTPLELTKGLIEEKRHMCDKIYTMGTSKGGTCAIFFGLLFGAEHIYSGACQYYVGNYLNIEERWPILRGMMGDCYSQNDINKLNEMMPNQIKNFKTSQSIIHLLYSKNEHTYDEHIVYLIEDLKRSDIKYLEIIENFDNHSEVGSYFIQYIKRELSIN